MRKLWAMLLIGCLILSGCARPDDNSSASTDTEEGAVSSTELTETDEKNNSTDISTVTDDGERNHFLWNDRAFFSNPYVIDCGIYEIPVKTQKDPVCILEKGAILDLCGSLLIAFDDKNIMMLDLEKDQQWTTLQEITDGDIYHVAGYSNGKLYFSGYGGDAQTGFHYYFEIVDLSTLEVKRIELEEGCIDKPLIVNDALYYTAFKYEASKRDFMGKLYCMNLTDLSRTMLCDSYATTTLYHVGDYILSAGVRTEPIVYNIATGASRVLKSFGESLAIVTVDGTTLICQTNGDRDLWAYDLVAEREVSVQDIGATGEIVTLTDSGIVNEDGANLTFVQEGKVYSLNLEVISKHPNTSGEVFNEHGAILNLFANKKSVICTIDWDTGIVNSIAPETLSPSIT